MHSYLQSAFAIEALSTYITFVRSFPRMDQFVSLQLLTANESFITNLLRKFSNFYFNVYIGNNKKQLIKNLRHSCMVCHQSGLACAWSDCWSTESLYRTNRIDGVSRRNVSACVSTWKNKKYWYYCIWKKCIETTILFYTQAKFNSNLKAQLILFQISLQ